MMLARTTRLEFLIVTVGLLVLLFCSKPPQPGSAEVEHALPAGQVSSWPPEDDDFRVDGNLPDSQTQGDESSDPSLLDAESTPPEDDSSGGQQPPRMGAVDARNIGQLPYNDVMYGDVTVRWVWNGRRFVPQKVCVVTEKDGVSSVWRFDEKDNTVVLELTEHPDSSR